MIGEVRGLAVATGYPGRSARRPRGVGRRRRGGVAAGGVDRPRVVEAEANPVLVLAARGGVVAVDAVVTVAGPDA